MLLAAGQLHVTQDNTMASTLIQRSTQAVIRGLAESSNALSGLEHRLLKGQLRELFVSNVLSSFLTNQLGIGTGVIVNQRGDESNQMDIVIYDRSLLPPLIREKHLGVYPAESVLATIEVKSRLDKASLTTSEEAAQRLHREIYAPEATIYPESDFPLPICSIIGFYGTGAKELASIAEGKAWLEANVQSLLFLGLINRYSWTLVSGLFFLKRCNQL